MTDPKTEIDELRALQQGKAERRARPRRADSNGPPVSEAQSGDSDGGSQAELASEGPSGDERAPEWEKTLEDLAVHLEGAVAEIEEVTREHPTFALLAAFAIGIVVGQLFSRR